MCSLPWLTKINERNASFDWSPSLLSNYLLLQLSSGNRTSLLQLEDSPHCSPNKQGAYSTLHILARFISPFMTPSSLISTLPNPAHD